MPFQYPNKINPHKFFSIIKLALKTYGIEYVLDKITNAVINDDNCSIKDFDTLIKDSLATDLVVELPNMERPLSSGDLEPFSL